MSRLYLEYFDLEQTPFAITPDPAFVFLSPRHQDALAHLLYGVGQGGGGGFVQLTGEVGTGKTTLCRCLLEQIPEDCRIALILNPALSPVELVITICDELSIDTSDCGGSLKKLVDRLNRFLLDAHAAGQQVVVVIDEAQNLSRDALEQVRLLTNLETEKEKLLQIVLLGQPELRDMLGQENLRQLAQRITARYHLMPLNRDETTSYVQHRLAVAGCIHNPFTTHGIKALYNRSGGVPRLINIIADRALVAGYAADEVKIGARIVHAAANEVSGEIGKNRVPGWNWAVIAVLAAVILWGLSNQDSPVPQPVVANLEAETIPVAEQATISALPVAEPSAPIAPPPLDQAQIGQLDQSAWASLAELWGRSDEQASLRQRCIEGQGSGFTCLRIQGSWNKIRQLGLPVILELPGEQADHLLLAGLGDRRALLTSAELDLSVALEELDQRWLGNFFVVWPQAEDWPRELAFDDQGTAVSLVKKMAAEVEFPYSDINSDLFDEPFEAWVKSFQRRSGLLDDGIIGPETLVYLMAPGIPSPRLQILPGS